MLHFSFDYLSMPITIFDDLIALQLLLALGVLLWIGLGMAFTVYFMIRIAEFLTRRTYLDEEHMAYAGVPSSGWSAQQTPDLQPRVQRQWHPTAGVGHGFFVFEQRLH